MVVVEGYFDCLKVHQAGFPSVVALMGAPRSSQQEALLRGRFQRIVRMLDGDDSGRRAAETIAAQLAGKLSFQLVRVPLGQQPDQMSQPEIAALLNPSHSQEEAAV
ncbi:MAG TPA: toprim domain-containing protein [Bryobacteraceae bacterium]|nr:toprim domain-containing protein [Bryobacteraceae bacterium]